MIFEVVLCSKNSCCLISISWGNLAILIESLVIEMFQDNLLILVSILLIILCLTYQKSRICYHVLLLLPEKAICYTLSFVWFKKNTT